MLSLFSAAPLAFNGAAPLAPAATRAAVSMQSKEELASALNPAVGYFDPLGLAVADFWGQGTEATYGFLRHSEIKHGRIAMFAFCGYCVQYNGIHCAFPMSLPESPSYAEGLTPPEQWDALPSVAKLQIFTFIAFLEFWGELSQSPHYMRGGKPGDYPDFPAAGIIPVTPIKNLNLFDPFGFSKNKSEEKKAKGLLMEINNGRLAMIGIIGMLSEQVVPGSVPLGPHLKQYTGEIMAPF